MKTTLAGLSLALVATAAMSKEDCPVVESNLIGAWGRSGDSGFFEEFMLSAEGGVRSFRSWLHQRPEFFGASWTFADCRLTITAGNGEFAGFGFVIRALENGKLELQDASDQEISTYARITDAD